MSLLKIKPYFKSKLDLLGFREWESGFDFDNIPRNIIDKSYHILLPNGSGGSINQLDQEVVSRVILRIFLKGFRSDAQAIDNCLNAIETISKPILKASNRGGEDIKNVIFSTYDILPLSENNNSIAILEIGYDVRTTINVEEQ